MTRNGDPSPPAAARLRRIRRRFVRRPAAGLEERGSGSRPVGLGAGARRHLHGKPKEMITGYTATVSGKEVARRVGSVMMRRGCVGCGRDVSDSDDVERIGSCGGGPARRKLEGPM